MAVTFDSPFTLVTEPIPGGSQLVFLTGTAIQGIPVDSDDWSRFDSLFVPPGPKWSNLRAATPVVSLAVVAGEGGNDHYGWAVDRTTFNLLDGRIALRCGLAVRGHATLVRLSYQVSAYGTIVPGT